MLEMIAQQGIPREIQSYCGQIEIGTCLCGKAFQSRETIYKKEIDQDHTIIPQHQEAQQYGHYILPIGNWGTFNVYIPYGLERNQDVEKFLNAVTQTLAQILQDNENDRARAELARRQENEKLDTLIAKQLNEFINSLGKLTENNSHSEVVCNLACSALLSNLAGDNRNLPAELRVYTHLFDSNTQKNIFLPHTRYFIKPDGSVDFEADFDSHHGPDNDEGRDDIFLQLITTENNSMPKSRSIVLHPGDYRHHGNNKQHAIIAQYMDLAKIDRGRNLGIEVENLIVVLVVKNTKDELLNRLLIHQALFESFVDRLESTFSLIKLIEALTKQAQIDALTGLNNRRTFDITLNGLGKTPRSRGDTSIVMLDIDHFKSVNDNYGHQVGDEVIKELAKLLKEAFRAGDFIARYGGEEFAVIRKRSQNPIVDNRLFLRYG